MKLNLLYLIFFILINFSNSQNINRNNLDSDVEITTESVYLMDNSGNISMNINVWGAVDRPGRLIVKEGVPSEKIIETLESDNAIRFLVLAAAESDQPGPLVSLLAGQKSGKLPAPVVIIPQGLSDDIIDDLASRAD